jgi:hypothetical protein
MAVGVGRSYVDDVASGIGVGVKQRRRRQHRDLAVAETPDVARQGCGFRIDARDEEADGQRSGSVRGHCLQLNLGNHRHDHRRRRRGGILRKCGCGRAEEDQQCDGEGRDGAGVANDP